MESSEFIDEAAKNQHSQWVKRNRSKPWVTKAQKGGFDAIAEEEREKSRMIVRTATRCYIAHAEARARIEAAAMQ